MPNQRAKGVFLAKFGVDRELWEAAQEKAYEDGQPSLSHVLREFLREYVAGQH